ncbi:Acyl-CoA-binding domain-containing protein [Dirofilaria immitis]
MVKLKNRYVLMDILFDEKGGIVTESAIYVALCKQIGILFGDYGMAAAKLSLNVKVFDAGTATTIVRISKEFAQRLLSAIPFVRSIDNIPVVLQVLFVGSSIRSCQRALLRINRKNLYSNYKAAKTDGERKDIMEAIRSVTGNVNRRSELYLLRVVRQTLDYVNITFNYSMETNDESTCDIAFKAAVDIIRNIPKKGVISVSANQKLRFYSLFKQGTSGKCNTPCPPAWHAIERFKWRAWNALGSMSSFEAKKIYIVEFKDIIDHVQREYDIAELAKGCDERIKKLLREKLSILGYDVNAIRIRDDMDDFRKRSCNIAKESYEMRKQISGNRSNELSDQYSESSTSTGEYVDAICCDLESCTCCREQLPNQRIDYRDDHHFFFPILEIEKLKMVMDRCLKVFARYDKLAIMETFTPAYTHPHTRNTRPPCTNTRDMTPNATRLEFKSDVKFLQSDVIMMASSASITDTKTTLPIHSECVKDRNIQLLFTKIDDLEQTKRAVSEALLDVVDKRIAYPKMITSYASEAGEFRIKRLEEAELVWQTESTGKKDIEKMLEMIDKIKEGEKENDTLLHHIKELERQNEELEKIAKMNDETIRNLNY